MGFLDEICSAEICSQRHQWQVQLLECPYGRGFLEVTWPDHKKLREIKENHPNVTIIGWNGDDLIPGPIMTAFSVGYSYVPYTLILSNVVVFVRQRGTRELSVLLFAGVMVFINELFLKELFQQARPEHSCLSSCGMPSGHSTLAVGFFTLMFLDMAFRVSPALLPEYLRSSLRDARTIADAGRSHRGTEQIIYLMAMFREIATTACGIYMRIIKDGLIGLLFSFTLTPLARGNEVSMRLFLGSVFLWCVILLPVPLSQVALRDHTPTQVLVGSVVGCVEGIVCAFLLRRFQFHFLGNLGKHYPSWEGSPRFRKFSVKHNLALPQYMVEAIVVLPMVNSSLQKSAYDSLEWYALQRLGAERRPEAAQLVAVVEYAVEVPYHDKLVHLQQLAVKCPQAFADGARFDMFVFKATWVILEIFVNGVAPKKIDQLKPRVIDILVMLRYRLVNEVKEIRLTEEGKEVMMTLYTFIGPYPLRRWLENFSDRYSFEETRFLRSWCEKVYLQAFEPAQAFSPSRDCSF